MGVFAKVAEKLMLRATTMASLGSVTPAPTNNVNSTNSEYDSQLSRRILRLEGEVEELQSLLTAKVKTPQGTRTRLSQLGMHVRNKRSFL